MSRAWAPGLRGRYLDWSRGRLPALPHPAIGNVMRRFIAKTKRCDRTGKVSYRDEHSANRAIQMITHISDREKVPGRAYECPFCKHWHLTSREELSA